MRIQNMNTSKLFTLLLALTFSFNVAAKSPVFDTEGASRAEYTCIAAATNDVSKLKALMKLEAYGQKNIVDNLHCNDLSITEFAAKYQAYDSIEYLNKYADSKQYIDVVALKNTKVNGKPSTMTASE